MLVYVDKPKAIHAFRPKNRDEGDPVRVASISKRGFEVEIASGVAVTKDESQQLETVAGRYRAAADSRRQWSALEFPEITRQVLAYYGGDASEVERQLIVATIRSASRAVRIKGPRPAPVEAPAAQQKSPLAALLRPSPDMVAAALYEALAGDSSAKVSGDPRKGEKTQISGVFNLQDVARALLARAP